MFLKKFALAVAGLVVAGLLVLVPEPSLDNRIVQGLAWGVLSGFSFALLAVSNRALRWVAKVLRESGPLVSG